MRRLKVLLALAALACVPGKEAADSAMAAVDTLKPAPDTGAQADTTSPVDTPATGAKSTSGAKTPGTQTGTKTAPPAPKDSNLGYDRAIKINTKDPRVHMPTVDTSRKRPE